MLAFVAGKVDMTFPTEMTAALVKDIKSQDPTAICEIKPINVSTNLIINRENPPFNNLELRKAMALALDRKAFIDIILQGAGRRRRRAAAAAGRRLGHAAGHAQDHPGLRRRQQGSRAGARDHDQARLRADKPLKIKVSTRNLATYRDPAVVLIDQLKTIYIDAELEPVESSAWFAKVARNDYSVGLNLTGNGIDDPDQAFYENFGCGSERNYTHYCNKDLQKLFDEQSQKPMSRSARSWCGTSTRSCRRTWRGRSCSTRAPAPAGSRSSRT